MRDPRIIPDVLGPDLEAVYASTLHGWSNALGLVNNRADDHTLNVARLTVHFARFVGVPDEELPAALQGAMLHDIGKVGVPSDILDKPGMLTEDEWKLMTRHTEIGYQILNAVDQLRAAAWIPYCHHERWDGTGYPRCLWHDQIPLPARLFTIVDVWDSLNADRPFRKAWPREKAVAHLRQYSGLYFDPNLMTIFMEMIEM
jgi:putative nucleotidyltransferase with HDIG domain